MFKHVGSLPRYIVETGRGGEGHIGVGAKRRRQVADFGSLNGGRETGNRNEVKSAFGLLFLIFPRRLRGDLLSPKRLFFLSGEEEEKIRGVAVCCMGKKRRRRRKSWERKGGRKEGDYGKGKRAHTSLG